MIVLFGLKPYEDVDIVFSDEHPAGNLFRGARARAGLVTKDHVPDMCGTMGPG